MKNLKLIGLLFGLILSFAINAQSEETTTEYRVYYFHNTWRCPSCSSIESMTKAALLGGKAENTKLHKEMTVEKSPYSKMLAEKKLTFEPLNIDEAKNKELMKRFAGSAKYPLLVKLVNGKMVKSVSLDKAWRLVNANPQDFVKYVQESFAEFIK